MVGLTLKCQTWLVLQLTVRMCVCTETNKYGILEVDSDLRVLCMKEKPHPSETKSRRAVSSHKH